MDLPEGYVPLNNNPTPASDKPLGDLDHLVGLRKKSMIKPAPGAGRERDTVMIYLDAILDTVMGTIAKHDPKLAVKLLDSERYRTRVLDQFAHITHAQFNELYAKRDVDTLKHSVLSNVPFFLQRMIKDCMVHSTKVNMEQELHFIVNTWPYDFDEAMNEMLKTCIRYHTFDTSTVTVVSISDAELVPQFVREELDIIIRYQYKDWLYMHREAFERNLCPHVTLVAPQIFQNGMIDHEGMLVCKRIGKSPFELAEEACANMIRLKIMPTSLFCVNDNFTKEKAADIISGLEIQPEDIEEIAKQMGATIVEEPALQAFDMNHIPNIVEEENL